MLTKRQKQILDYIKKYIKDNDYAPTYEEIRRHFRLSSRSTVHQHIEALRNKGYLEKLDYQTRGIQILKNKKSSDLVSIPLLGTIAAGQPIEAIEDKETIAIPKSKLSKSGNFYALRVSGNSMIDENINDRDIVIVKNQPTANNGDRVVALIDNNEVTLKKLYKEKNKIRLQPANPKIEPIYVDPENLIIQGIVIDIIKNLPQKKISIKPKIQKVDKNIEIEKKQKFINLPTTNEPLILIGDVLDKLSEIPDESISCIITSPPYWNLRDYGKREQIGQEPNPEGYINKLTEVGKELRRVLKKEGTFFLNIGDTYINRDLQMVPERMAIALQKNGWKLRNKIIWHKPNHMPSSIKNRLGNTYEPIFFFIRDDCKKKYFFDLDAIRIPHKSNSNNKKSDLPQYIDEKTYRKYYSHLTKQKTTYNGKFKGNEKNKGASPGARLSLSGEYYTKQRKHEVDSFEICSYLKEWKKKSRISTKEVDKIFGYKDTAGHWFRTDDSGRSLPGPEDWIKLKKILKLDNKYDKIMTETHYVLQTVQNHPNGKNPGDVWSINIDKIKEAHFAIFPEELPRKIIKACCPKDGIVLDHFAGSGTTGKVAKELNIKSIMIDINPEYKKIMERRFREIQPTLPF